MNSGVRHVNLRAPREHRTRPNAARTERAKRPSDSNLDTCANAIMTGLATRAPSIVLPVRHRPAATQVPAPRVWVHTVALGAPVRLATWANSVRRRVPRIPRRRPSAAMRARACWNLARPSVVATRADTARHASLRVHWDWVACNAVVPTEGARHPRMHLRFVSARSAKRAGHAKWIAQRPVTRPAS